LFPLGNVFLTIGAREALEESGEQPFDFFLGIKQAIGELIGKEDWEENDCQLKKVLEFFRLTKQIQDVKFGL
jgi:hypothetical protein